MMTHDISSAYDDLTLDRANRSHARSAFLCGLLTGAALGLLFAPARGRETRRRLGVAARDRQRRVGGFVRQNWQTLSEQPDRVAAIVDRTRERVERTASEATAAVKHARAAFDHALNRTS